MGLSKQLPLFHEMRRKGIILVDVILDLLTQPTGDENILLDGQVTEAVEYVPQIGLPCKRKQRLGARPGVRTHPGPKSSHRNYKFHDAAPSKMAPNEHEFHE